MLVYANNEKNKFYFLHGVRHSDPSGAQFPEQNVLLLPIPVVCFHGSWLLSKPDAPDGTFPKVLGFISPIHLVKSPLQMFKEGSQFTETLMVIG